MHIVSEQYEALNAGTAQAEAVSAGWLPPPAMRRFFPLYVDAAHVDQRLPAFRSLLLQGVQLKWPDTPSPGSPWYSTHPWSHPVKAWRELRRQQRRYAALLARRGEGWPGFVEDGIGQPYRSYSWLFLGSAETEANLRNNLYYGLLRAMLPQLDQVRSVLDLGGGFGGFVSVLAQRHPKMRLTLVELPFMCVMATYCLAQRCGGILSMGGWSPAARVQVLPPWQIDTMRDPVDLVINTLSFQHWSLDNFTYYGDHLQRLGRPPIWSFNRVVPRWAGEVPYLSVMSNLGYHSAKRDPVDSWLPDHEAHLLVEPAR
jgi:putative sugar O-methyltransferase